MYRVVVVDDEVLIRMYIREILENNGYEVVGEAEDGLDAINVWRAKARLCDYGYQHAGSEWSGSGQGDQ